MLIIKTKYSSHFKFKKIFKNRNKSIFLKNFFFFILFSKIFFKNFFLKIFYKKVNTKRIDLLKAPSRHKKFFHQINNEYFNILIVFTKKKNFFTKKKNFLRVFLKLNSEFACIGSNTLTRSKFSVTVGTDVNKIILF